MKKTMYFLLLIFASCKSSTKEAITEEDLKDATSFFIESMVNKATHGNNYTIDTFYDTTLTDSDFFYLAYDTILTRENVEYMKVQYKNFKNRRPIEFVNERYHSKMQSASFKKGYFHYFMSIPMFTKDKKRFVIYSKTFFWVQDTIRWDDLYFVFKKKENNWKREVFLNRPK
jgi:hypothetical protein